MEMQQIMEILAKLNAKMDANQAETKANRKANQARMEANKRDMLAEISTSMKSHQEMMKSNQDLLARLKARIETNKKKDREDIKEKGKQLNLVRQK
jgi:hypothetical protein